ncbi:MAG: hypothetical protein CMC74_05065 [Flavobacteriaceae bacterium]|nr:hypothetical protein [Flavobacteriaceae bacterium]|tara:strand:- start:14585 stop:16507 length:1923 start_codon:yes stop_codon:yes gene_type:complete
MQFKHPEILYALLLLLIPIIIHLFQLRRFQKVAFTNVEFLKKATLQTRKSSQVKKWLVLLTRLVALACIILAFAQPFTASKTALNSEKETVIYIDNSFSMEAKGSNGPMLKRSLQQLYDHLEGEENISWFTNDVTKKGVSITDFKNEVLSIDYSPMQLSLEAILLKAEQLFSQSNTAEKRLVIISDFQDNGSFPEVPKNIKIEAVKTKPVTVNNLSIDTAFVLRKTVENTQLQVVVSAEGEWPESVPVSLWNDERLVAKTAVDLSNTASNSITFDIENPENLKGKITLTDAHLQYDNNLFFSINLPEKIKVLSINEGEAGFLQKLFDNEKYAYKQQNFNQLNYSDLPSQNFVVLNELKQIPKSLITALKAFEENGGSLLVIPSKEAEINTYNNLLNTLQIGQFQQLSTSEKKITKIHFSHPLYEEVFEKQVTNFQYPTVQSFFEITHQASKVLELEDGSPFLLQKGNNYIATAAFSRENSNFKNSPLIVPSLINMAQQSLPLPNLYYEIGQNNTFAVPVKLGQDEILTVEDSLSSFIPLQQTKANSVAITTTEVPTYAGNFTVNRKEDRLQLVSYNNPRNESRLRYLDPKNWEGTTSYNSVEKVFEAIAKSNHINSLWKWFVIFAVLFLIIELCILKFFK